jgi:hypothetical protein
MAAVETGLQRRSSTAFSLLAHQGRIASPPSICINDLAFLCSRSSQLLIYAPPADFYSVGAYRPTTDNQLAR